MKQLAHIWLLVFRRFSVLHTFSFSLSLAERGYRGRASSEWSAGDPLHRDQSDSTLRDQKLQTLLDDRGEDWQWQDGHVENPSERPQHPAPQWRSRIQPHTCEASISTLSLSLDQ